MKPTILVVDDQKGVRHLICEALRDLNITVHEAGSGPEALQKLAECEYPLILLDMKMPGMTGLEMLRILRGQGCTSRVVLMTAYDELDFALQAEGLDVFRCVAKPFDIVELRGLVKETLVS